MIEAALVQVKLAEIEDQLFALRAEARKARAVETMESIERQIDNLHQQRKRLQSARLIR